MYVNEIVSQSIQQDGIRIRFYAKEKIAIYPEVTI